MALRLRKRYQVRKYFFGQEWGAVLHQADLVISRAGANILTELALLGKPMLLVPIPWLKNKEQLENAKMFKEFGVAEVLKQEELTPRKLMEEIDRMMEGIKGYRKEGELLKKKIKKNAAKKIFEEAQKLV